MKQIILTKDSDIVMSLLNSDPQLEILFELIGQFELSLRTNYFLSLVRSIIGQQLSVKAAKSIWTKLVQLCGRVEPQIILSLEASLLRDVGISRPKISYIKDLSEKVLNQRIDLEQLQHVPEREVIYALTGVKGIGEWTAQMFLIFSLGRLDIMSATDVGLRRSVKWLYRLEETPGIKEMESYGEKWRPYRSVVSLYLWEIINRGFIR